MKNRSLESSGKRYFAALAALSCGTLLADSAATGDGKQPPPPTWQLEWTQIIGGSKTETLGWMREPRFDAAGMLTITGTTKSPDFPVTADAFDATYGGGSSWGKEDAFVLQFDTNARTTAYCTLLGGAAGPDHLADVRFDSAGRLYLVGNTGSSDFPVTTDARTPTFPGPDFRHADGFLTILGERGRKLAYSTYVGGAKNDWTDQVFLERSGEITIFGITESPDFPGTDTIRSTELKPGPALFVMRMNATGQRILFSRLLANAWGTSIHRLDDGSFVIAGSTNNRDIATTDGALGRKYAGGTEMWGGDIFLMGLSADLKTIRFTTLFGGSGEESWPWITSAKGGDLFVVGATKSKDLPVTADALEPTMTNKEALFLARFDSDGRVLRYCTFLGGSADGARYGSRSIAYDGDRRLCIASSTPKQSFPVTPDALQSKHHGKQDIFLLGFDVADNAFVYGTYFGGAGEDDGSQIAFGRDGALFLVGMTKSPDLPTTGQTALERKGSWDVFISKLVPGREPPPPDSSAVSFDCDYLGETPPGTEPVVFGRSTVSVEGRNTHALQISPDGRMMIFSCYPDGTSYFMVHQGDGWSAPQRTSFTGKEITFDAAHRRLFFYAQGGDLFWVRYGDEGFSPPTPLDARFNTREIEFYPSMTASGNLYFGRNGNWANGRVMMARPAGDGFEDPIDLGDTLNTGGVTHAFVAPDESYMLFNSLRTGSHTRNDIWASFRHTDGTWSEPVNLGTRINFDPEAAMLCPTVSPDGKYLFFTRLQQDRTGFVYWVRADVIEELRK